ncbi:transcription factor DIVARICATA-like [Quercus suber]|uniref:Transcription factor divaricata n=1 Tax=Quercus suber TaxID=58331 RepID=A0AAW0LZV5_QUESU
MEPSYFSNSSLCNPSLSCLSRPPQLEYTTEWSFEENKIFENALAEFDLDCPQLFEKIAIRLPQKTVPQIKKHLEDLSNDIEMIDSGLISVPNFIKTSETNEKKSAPAVERKSGKKRRKGVPWTSEEHELFLRGLEKFGKGDWRSISRQCVVTKNPTQVASHAQKYFLRLQNSGAQAQQSTLKPSNKTSKEALMSSTAFATATTAVAAANLPAPSFASTSDQFYASFHSYHCRY